MLTRRIVVCLDVRDGKVTKGIQFKGNVDIGDPVEMAKHYCADGCDELVFYDITASAENRSFDFEMMKRVAKEVSIPFTVGGGIRNVADIRDAIHAGADKVSINSLAVRNPQMISDGAREFGNQCIVLGMDVAKVGESEKFPSGYEVVTRGGRQREGLDAVEWAKRAVELGAGEIVLNSIDADGMRSGYDLEITEKIAQAVDVPVVASGGAGEPLHIRTLFLKTKAAAALVASMVHYGDYTCKQIKEACADIAPMRMDWKNSKEERSS